MGADKEMTLAMERPEAVLFDLDGVLIDSETLYTEFWDKTERLYPTGIDNFASAIKGTNLDSILRLFKPEERDEILIRILDFDSHLTYPMFPGALELLARLQKEQIPAALVTSSNPEKMEQLFRQYPDFERYFTAIVNGSMVSRGKPDPEGYLLAAKLLGKAPERCLVIEDSLQGVRAGRAAGCRVWGLATTLPAATIAPDADRIFPDIAAASAALHSSK